MRAAIARKTLRDQRRSLTGWGIGMVAVVAMYSTFFPSIRDNAAKLNDLMNSLPAAIKAMVGESSFTTPTGYLQSETFSLMAPMLLLIFAIGAGSRAIAGEEDAGTLDLLLANPITRGRTLLEKVGAMIVATGAIGLLLWGSILLIGPLFGLNVGVWAVGAATLAVVLEAIAFGSIAIFVGCWRGRRGTANAAAAALAVGMYLLNVLAPSWEAVKPARTLSLFYYYLSSDPLRHGVSIPHTAVLVGTSFVAIVAATLVFDRRDLRA